MAKKSDLEMAILTSRKVARTAIRLKHSIAADYELNEKLALLEAKLSEQARTGELPAYGAADLLALASGIDDVADA